MQTLTVTITTIITLTTTITLINKNNFGYHGQKETTFPSLSLSFSLSLTVLLNSELFWLEIDMFFLPTETWVYDTNARKWNKLIRFWSIKINERQLFNWDLISHITHLHTHIYLCSKNSNQHRWCYFFIISCVIMHGIIIC